jgi:ADP-heptose:LPS heptosyltransferase
VGAVAALLDAHEMSARRVIGVHAGAGRAVKQWPPERLAAVATTLAREAHAAIVLTGSGGDRPIIDAVRRSLPPDVTMLDLAGTLDLVRLGALFARLDLVITGDTGPMHLAAAVDAPLVAIFGPSSPARYGPLSHRAAVVRIDLPCAPCNRIRQPPARCVGHTPDCLHGLPEALVLDAARAMLSSRSARAARSANPRLQP